MLDRLWSVLSTELRHHHTPVLLLAVALAGVTLFASYQAVQLQSRADQIESDQALAAKKLQDASFQEHLNILERRRLEELGKIASGSAIPDAAREKKAKIDQVLSLYQDVQNKVTRDQGVKLEVKDITDQIADWGKKFLGQEFDAVIALLTSASSTLDQRYQTYLAALPKTTTTNPTGYSYQTVATVRGSFGVYLVKLP